MSSSDSESCGCIVKEVLIGDDRIVIRHCIPIGNASPPENGSQPLKDAQSHKMTKVTFCVRGVISPTLANIYLHYSFDLWAERWRHHEAHGNVVYVRYADDIVAGFEHESDAVRFLAELRERLEKFALSLHPDKTRLIEFGRHAATDRAKRGLGKPETFNFLGFTHICGRSRRGSFLLHRRTRRDRMRVKLRALKGELKRRMHEPIPQQGRWLDQVVRGYFAYHAVPTNSRAWPRSDTTLCSSGGARCGVAARRTGRRGITWCDWRRLTCRCRASFTPGPTSVLPSNTPGGSPVRELRPPGSVRGAPSNGRPYRIRVAVRRNPLPFYPFFYASIGRRAVSRESFGKAAQATGNQRLKPSQNFLKHRNARVLHKRSAPGCRIIDVRSSKARKCNPRVLGDCDGAGLRRVPLRTPCV